MKKAQVVKSLHLNLDKLKTLDSPAQVTGGGCDASHGGTQNCPKTTCNTTH